MISSPTEPAAPPPWRGLLVLFFLSGFSALLYEVVWVRMLARILGCTVYATASVLAAYMAGLAIGSLLFGRFADRLRRPLFAYAVLELGIGLSALASLLLPDRLVPLYRWFHALSGGSRSLLTVGQILAALPVLLLPTVLMGATLPALTSFGARRVCAWPAWAGILYAFNTLGAVGGVLLSGFVLLGAWGETRTLLFGAILNAAVGLAAFLFGRRVPAALPIAAALGGPPPPPESGRPAAGAENGDPAEPYPGIVRRAILAAFAVSGGIALAQEVVWSRMLLLYQGTSIYAFSAMLAVVLLGMGVGSFFGTRLLARTQDPLRWFARIQILAGLAGAAALHLFAAMGRLPQPEIAPGKGLYLIAAAPLVLLGPLGLAWGFLFPAAARSFGKGAPQAGREVSRLYAWNTVGCIAGSLLGGFLLVPLLGVSRSAAGLSGLSVLTGVLIFFAHPGGFKATFRLSEWTLVIVAAAGLATAGDPYRNVIFQRVARAAPRGAAIYLHKEGVTGTTTAFGDAGGAPIAKDLWVNGVGMTVLVPETKLMAHLPIWLADDPKDVLVICFGMGTSLRSASRYPGITVRAVELVPEVVEAFPAFHADGPLVLDQPNVDVKVDDGRNHLLMNDRRYDVITIDPAPPLYSAGEVNLYSGEFFALCRGRLKPGGVMCLWIPGVNESEVRMIFRTFLDAFPHVEVFGGRVSEGFFVLGRETPFPDFKERFERGFQVASTVNDLGEWRWIKAYAVYNTPRQILDLHLAGGKELRTFVGDAPAVTDDRPRTEFPLWRAVRRDPLYLSPLTSSRMRAMLGK